MELTVQRNYVKSTCTGRQYLFNRFKRSQKRGVQRCNYKSQICAKVVKSSGGGTKQGYEKWLSSLRAVFLDMIQDTIAHEQSPSSHKFESKIEAETEFDEELENHPQFRNIVVLRDLFLPSSICEQPVDVQWEVLRNISLGFVKYIFKTDFQAKFVEIEDSYPFIDFVDWAATSATPQQLEKINKFLLYFQILQQLPERVEQNPSLYKLQMQQLARLMECSPIPYFQDLQLSGRGNIIQLGKLGFFWVTCQYNNLDLLQQLLQKKFSLFMYDQSYQSMAEVDQVRQLTTSLSISCELGCIEIGEDNLFLSLLLENDIYKISSVSKFQDMFTMYVVYYHTQAAKAYREILSIFIIYMFDFDPRHFSVSSFQDGIVNLWFDREGEQPKLTAKKKNISLNSYKLNWYNLPINKYSRNFPNQLPGMSVQWVTYNEALLASLGTPMLTVAFMMLRLIGLFMQKESELSQDEQYKFLREGVSDMLESEDLKLQYKERRKLIDFNKEIESEKDGQVFRLRNYLLNHTYNMFFEIGSISLLIAANNFRNQVYAPNSDFSVVNVEKQLQDELQFQQNQSDLLLDNFLKSAVEDEYYNNEIRREILQLKTKAVEIGQKGLDWIGYFKYAQQEFLLRWNKVESWDDVCSDFLQELTDAALFLTTTWLKQTSGMPFLKEFLDGVAEALFITMMYVIKNEDCVDDQYDLLKFLADNVIDIENEDFVDDQYESLKLQEDNVIDIIPDDQNPKQLKSIFQINFQSFKESTRLKGLIGSLMRAHLGDYENLLYVHSSKLVCTKMIQEGQGLQDITADMLCMLAMPVLLEESESPPVLEALKTRMSKMSTKSPFAKKVLETQLQLFLLKEEIDEAVELLKMQGWEQDFEMIAHVESNMELFEEYESAQNVVEFCQVFFSLPCQNERDQMAAFMLLLSMVEMLEQSDWELLLQKVILSYSGRLFVGTAELILQFVPATVLQNVMQAGFEENLDVLKQGLAIRILSGSKFKKDKSERQEIGFMSFGELKKHKATFSGGIIRRGADLQIIDQQFIEYLLEKLQLTQANLKSRMNFINAKIRAINKHTKCTPDMFTKIVAYLREWEIWEHQILTFIQTYNTSENNLQQLLVEQLLICIQKEENLRHAYDAVDPLLENQQACELLLTAIFEEDFNMGEEYKIQWVKKLKAGVPRACTNCTKLVQFVSKIDGTFEWFTQYGAPGEINQVIRSNFCEEQLLQKLVDQLLQNKQLELASVEFLLQNQDVQIAKVLQLLQYISDQDVGRLSQNSLKQIASLLNEDNFQEFTSFGADIVNGLIFALFQAEKNNIVLLVNNCVREKENFYFDWRGFCGSILSQEMQHKNENALIYDNNLNDIINTNKRNLYFMKNFEEVPYESTVHLIDIIIDNVPNLSFDIFSFVFLSELDEQTKLQIILPRIQRLLNDSNNQNNQDIEDFINSIFGAAIKTNLSSEQIFSSMFRFLQQYPQFEFQVETVFQLTQLLLNENQFDMVLQIFQEIPNSKLVFKQEKWLKLFQTVASKLQSDSIKLNDDFEQFLFYFFEFEISNINDYLFQISSLVLQQNHKNFELVNKVIQNTFNNELNNVKNLVTFLDVFSQMEVTQQLPNSVLDYIEENLDQLVPQFSQQTLQFFVLGMKNEDRQICLRCYDFLHSKYKQEITPQIWKSALLNSNLTQQFENGLEILKQISKERRIKEEQWQLNDHELQSAEINFEIQGDQNFEGGWELITKLWNNFGVIPQKEIQILLKFLIDQQNPHSCGVIVEKIMQSLRSQISSAKLELSLLFALTNAITCSDQSIDKEASIIYIFISVINSQNLSSENNQLQDFFAQCLLCNPQLLPAIITTQLSCGIEISSEIMGALDYDENAQNLLNQWFKCESIEELMFEKSMEELQNMAQTQTIKVFVENYLKSLLQKNVGGQLDKLNGYEEGQNEEWRGYEKSRWLAILVEDENWKQWPQDKLIACAKKFKGNKLKQYKQKRDLIQIVEKELDNILMRS